MIIGCFLYYRRKQKKIMKDLHHFEFEEDITLTRTKTIGGSTIQIEMYLTSSVCRQQEDSE